MSAGTPKFCGTCRHWHRIGLPGEGVWERMGRCYHVKNEHATVLPISKGTGEIATRDDFGCVLHSDGDS